MIFLKEISMSVKRNSEVLSWSGIPAMVEPDRARLDIRHQKSYQLLQQANEQAGFSGTPKSPRKFFPARRFLESSPVPPSATWTTPKI